MIPLIAFCSSLLLLFSSEPLPRNEWFSGHLTTSDELYWNGQRYYIDASPIDRFEDYVGLYPRIPDPPSGMEPLYDRPRVHDKNYSIRWKIADSMLYVCDVNFAAVGPYEYGDYFLPDGNARFGPLETLTGERFDRDAPAAEIAPVGPCGVLPARWYTGELYLKPYPDWEFTEYARWIEMPVLRLTFDRGRVTEVRRLKGDMLPDPDRKEAWRQRDPLLGVPRVASVTTSDELEWDGLRYNMSETPLTAFPKYKRGIFRQVPGDLSHSWRTRARFPVVQDKHYSVVWKLVDSMLYVADLDFYTLRDPENDLGLFWVVDTDDRFRTLEKLTGERFEKNGAAASAESYGPFGRLPATWFSGGIYIKESLDKRTPKADYGPWRTYPVRKLTFENGRLVRVEDVDGAMTD